MCVCDIYRMIFSFALLHRLHKVCALKSTVIITHSHLMYDDTLPCSHLFVIFICQSIFSELLPVGCICLLAGDSFRTLIFIYFYFFFVWSLPKRCKPSLEWLGNTERKLNISHKIEIHLSIFLFSWKSVICLLHVLPESEKKEQQHERHN